MQLAHLIQQHFIDLSKEWEVPCNVHLVDMIDYYVSNYVRLTLTRFKTSDEAALKMDVWGRNDKKIWYRIFFSRGQFHIDIRKHVVGTIYDPDLFPNLSKAFELFIELSDLPHKLIHKRHLEWKNRKVKFRWER